jgi:hypothetical protein
MRSGWLRRSSRLVATLVLLVSVWQMPHRWQDDEVCLPIAEAHDESKHVYTAPQTAAHEDHCAVCHWTRWLKPVFASSATMANAGSRSGDLLTFAGESVRDPGSDHLPPRAPPTLG